jgi:hypothetical protein
VPIALTVAWSNANPGRPMLVVEEDRTFLCGRTLPGTYGRHSWVIRNAGSVPLKLRTRFTSGRCGFSLWLGGNYTIPPEGRLTVSLTWPTPLVGAMTYSSHAEVWTNDPMSPKVRFKVVGVVVADPPAD